MLKELPVRQRGVCCNIEIGVDAQKLMQQAELLRALADPTRLGMLAVLRDARQPVCICDLTAAFEHSQPTISHHMGRLRDAGLVESEKRGIWAFYSLREDISPAVERLLEALSG